jgi:hypothetical protein
MRSEPLRHPKPHHATGRSPYYAAKARAPSVRTQRDAVLGPVVRQLWDDNYRVYGARSIWKAARRAGHDVGRDQVARLMRGRGIEGVIPMPNRPFSCRSSTRCPSRSVGG